MRGWNHKIRSDFVSNRDSAGSSWARPTRQALSPGLAEGLQGHRLQLGSVSFPGRCQHFPRTRKPGQPGEF